eukprot:CAMPEP_0197632498 /NCGR_PEP_ID=MMETSP1338-20131121/9219_2 /TAXON_ID=43686 ORGANISM="Pelagodinium beii, Strain RCC1491" /NCGR_SAMPLE_ID=MMETSP1338 /ASSEMBLY_ACC=CAM_ASM_000754 /LENGTH=74 /DNA_ID=CAMNT_0043204061 /DNA_START=243 /DNA_END=467 /DNA_ORIENTATION=-
MPQKPPSNFSIFFGFGGGGFSPKKFWETSPALGTASFAGPTKLMPEKPMHASTASTRSPEELRMTSAAAQSLFQ